MWIVLTRDKNLKAKSKKVHDVIQHSSLSSLFDAPSIVSLILVYSISKYIISIKKAAPRMRTFVSILRPSLNKSSKLSASVRDSRRHPFHFLTITASLEPSTSRTLKTTSSQREKCSQGPRIFRTWTTLTFSKWRYYKTFQY